MRPSPKGIHTAALERRSSLPEATDLVVNHAAATSAECKKVDLDMAIAVAQ